ncbi:BSCL2-like protein [Mya arenaria]|uniref:Seipin n=1 Tax=Mya arenaria TaxID=6604 RepID=A0ABY7FCW8_MYAAR|nr:BSCL2-like protein [Mya arenaria]
MYVASFYGARVCDSGVGMCSFPTANISLSKDGENQVFKVGQPYKIIVDLHVPESDSNRNIGMFMLVMKLYNKHGVVVKTSGRAFNPSVGLTIEVESFKVEIYQAVLHTGASGGRLALETLGSHDSSDTEQPRDPEETSLLSTGVRTQHDTHTPGVRQRLSRPADVT